MAKVFTLGKAGIHDEGEWSSSKDYERLSLVTSGKSLYLARKAVPSGTALDSAEHWRELVGFDGDWGALEADLRAEFDTAKSGWDSDVSSAVSAANSAASKLGGFYLQRADDGKIHLYERSN